MKKPSSSTIHNRPATLVLTDWGANVEGLGRDPKTLAYELMILSLLYDEILIQDEVLVLSNKLARWFAKPEDLTLFRKLFLLNTIVVLTHPLLAYPTDHLKNLATKRPIEARAEYIKQYGTKGGVPFYANHFQNSFFSEIESCLRLYRWSNRPVGGSHSFDIMTAFKTILRDILSNQIYAKWLRSAFRGITPKLIAELIVFIDDPSKAVNRIRQKDAQAPILFGSDNIPVFNRSFGFQIANLYPSSQSNSIKRLIQTTFAAPFCWRENAVGRYSGSLRELLWVPNLSLSEIEENDSTVSVEAHVELPMSLPEITLDFPDIIQKVRESKAGKALRKSVRTLGKEIEFNQQIEIWKAVADELARFAISKKPIKMSSTVINFGKRAVTGTVIKGLYDLGVESAINWPKSAFVSLLGAGAGVLFDHGLQLLRQDLLRQKLRHQLEQAVEFRCNWIPKPPELEFKSGPID